jgi:WS/DGAT/MGAT family acyltransferase
MERMTGADAVFLGMETPSTPQHVGCVAVLEVGSQGVDIERLKRNVSRVLPLVPKFTRIVKQVPFGLDLPVWDNDTNFDIDRHVRHIAVPPPGGREQVGNLIGELISMQLDRRFPLWELWVIDGLAEGRRAATFLKYHHSLMDGKSGASLAEQLFQLGPDDEPAQAEPAPKLHTPSSLELLLRTPIRGVQSTWQTAEYAAAIARRTVATLRHRRRGGRMPALLAPATVFNGAVGRRRQLAYSSVPLDDVKRIAKDQQVKVNDVIMTLVAGAARSYLSGVGDLPAEPINAFIAVSTSVADADGHGNSVASVPIPLPTNLADPRERLREVFDSTSHAKELLEAIRAHKIQSIGAVAPPVLLNLASQALSRPDVLNRLPTPANLIVSNIPGPPIPLYQSGAKVLGLFAASVLLANGALNITLMSYNGRIDFGLTVDPDIVPHAQLLADAIPLALTELLSCLGLGSMSALEDAWT